MVNEKTVYLRIGNVIEVIEAKLYHSDNDPSINPRIELLDDFYGNDLLLLRGETYNLGLKNTSLDFQNIRELECSLNDDKLNLAATLFNYNPNQQN
ncbi:hypothetical protein J4440_06925 [Candidatus Woesearchaeota archaeon]|nr:hypothetical protein [Candidatus Woesearchaeota archaeon]